MSIDKAYSKQYKKNITASEADFLFKKGIITSKYEFECPDKNCTAQIICANLDKPQEKRKVPPYFKFSNDTHVEGCSIGENREKEKQKIKNNGAYSDKLEYQIGAVRLDLTLPQVANKPQLDSGNNSSNSTSSTISTKNRQKQIREQHKRISSLVANFNNGDNFEVQLPNGFVVLLQDFFTKINGQNINIFDDELHGYYGKAWINKYEGRFQVKFDSKLKWGDMEIRPTFFINQEDIDSYPNKKFQVEQLEKLSGNIPKNVYLICDVAPYLSKSGKYINFKLENLAYLEIIED
ncbi:hypothetical protein [Pasteurella atlantica]|uniref:hypothetical protein n=1 Tax=Pasteurellaceae TaxID=712 RepID=UPI00277724E4|nr:hypothetical protein [Pasteurella atlantica]MDP8100053.1 hypothetical protein [Pasteurella atlantica]MDP8107963.1 hypothetical protein [Pasteurella atlantica]MDP8117665.1 hypothetical protein [Pasteurella atlantica]